MNNRWCIEKHLLQQASLPEQIIHQVEQQFAEPITLYGHYDLNDALVYQQHWLVIGGQSVFLFNQQNGELISRFALNQVIRTAYVKHGSVDTLTFIGDNGPLAQIHYSGKQRAMMAHIKDFVDQRHTPTPNNQHQPCPHQTYQTHCLAALKEIQNASSGNKQHSLWRLLGYLKPYQWYFLLGSMSGVIATFLALMPPFLSAKLVDDLINPFHSGKIDGAVALESAWILVVLLGVSYVFKEFFDWLRLRQMTVMGEWVAKDLRQQIFVHLQRLDLSYFSQQSTGGLVTRVSADSERVWDFIAFGVIDVSIALLTLVGLSAMLIYLDWQLGLIMALPLPLLLWSIFLHGQQIERLFTKCWRKWSQMTAIIADAIPGIMVVKAFSQQDQEINKFTIANNEAADEFVGQHLAWAKFWPMLVLGIHMIIIIAWCSALPRLFAPESDLSVGTFIAFLLYMTMYTQPVEVLGQMALMMNKATSSAQRIFEVLDTKAKITSPENAIMPDNLKGSIEFDRVSFSYNGIQPVLNNISFSVAPGEMIGLVGISGGGKSTITRLISRFYDCDQGSVLIDGINVKSFELNALRKNIGVVLQDPYLFRSSIWQNIAYGLPDISLSKVIDAARVANAHDFIMALPQGYETVIGERGHTLSGGERQRISIARAILHNPAILILDEATSSVDTQTERQIQQALDKVIKGRTVIAIAHRLSTLDKADRIFVIKQGEIVQSGTHQTLLSEPSGPYHALYYTQHSQQSGPSAQNRPSPQHPNPAGNANVQD